jgi:hypothetical protein
MTRKNCETQVLGDIIGGFLVRENATGRKVLSVKTGMEQVSHFNLHQDQEEEVWTLDKDMYMSLPELVDYYRENKLPGQNIPLALK